MEKQVRGRAGGHRRRGIAFDRRAKNAYDSRVSGDEKRHDEPECLRCGTCCLADMIACADAEDVRRWKRAGREDILHIIDNERAVWMGDHLVSARDGRELHHCPFLEWVDGRCSCAIYEVRPRVCAEYRPGSSAICPLFKK